MSKLDGIIAELRKRHKNAVIATAEEIELPWFVDRYATGIVTLDAAIGGGIPPASITEFIGPEGVGKTYLANRVIAMGQKHYGDNFIAFVAMTEGRYDKLFAQMAGVKIPLSKEEIQLLEEVRKAKFTKEEKQQMQQKTGELLELRADTIEELFATIIDATATGEFHIGIVDSIKAGETREGKTRDIGERAVADRVLSIQDFTNKLLSVLIDPKSKKFRKTAVILINQFRAKIGTMLSGDVFTKMEITGGSMLKHLKMLSIGLANGKAIKENGEQIGKEVRWKILKGKAGTYEGKTGSFRFIFNRGVDEAADLLTAALLSGIAQSAGGWITLNLGDKKEKLHGMTGFVSYLAENPEICDQIRDEYFRTIGLAVRYGGLK